MINLICAHSQKNKNVISERLEPSFSKAYPILRLGKGVIHWHPDEVVDISLQKKLLSPPVLNYLSCSYFPMILWEATPPPSRGPVSFSPSGTDMDHIS